MPAVPAKKTRQWGDEEEDAEENETPIDAYGVREKVRNSVNSKGQRVKTITKVRVKEIKMRIPSKVASRKNLPRFGDCVIGEVNVTIKKEEVLRFEHPDEENQENPDEGMNNALKNFIVKQTQRNMIRTLDMDDEDEAGGAGGDADGFGSLGKSGNAYVPPGARDGGSSMPAADNTENTIRVSNLTKAVTEDDLRDLFDRFGAIRRISLPKVAVYDEVEKMEIKVPRGFAYIAFVNHSDAEKALSLQGYGYDHLIIKLEWAKPTKPDAGGGGGGGMNPSFMSGYGQKLAQDTTEKVSYHSHGRSV